MTLLFDPPAIYELPVSKGGDLWFGFRYKPLVVDDAGEPVLDGQGQKQYAVADFPSGSSVTLVIETDVSDTPIEVQATIDGSMATVLADFTVADTVKDKKLWRAIITFDNGLDQVLANGLTTRRDGKAPKP